MKAKFCAAVAVLALIVASATSALAQEWEHAVSLFNQKQYRPAIREFRAVLAASPDAWKSWFYVGASHYYLQEYQEAIEPLQNLIKAAEKDEASQLSGQFFLGWSYYQLKQYGQATPALARYIALSEKTQQKVDPASRVLLGRCYILTDRFSDAVTVLTTAVAEIKTDAVNYYLLGLAQQKLGRTDQAIAALNQAIAINPKYADALAQLAEIYFSQMKQNPAMSKQVIGVGERLIIVRNDEYTWGLLGQAYLLDKQFAKAAPMLDKYARAHPDVAATWFQLGLALSRSDQFKPAAEALEQAVKLSPKNISALLEMGYVYERDKQYDRALDAYQRAYEASGQRDETARAGIDRVKQVKP